MPPRRLVTTCGCEWVRPIFDPHSSLTHSSQPPKRHLDRFTRFRAANPCAQIADLSPLVAANRFVRFWPHLINGSLDPLESPSPNCISIGSCAFAHHVRLINTHIQTYTPCYVYVRYIILALRVCNAA